MKDIIFQNLITIIYVFILIFGFIRGFKQGIIKKVLSLGTIIFSIIATKYLTPIVANMIKSATNCEATLTDFLYKLFESSSAFDKLEVMADKRMLDTGKIGSSIKDGLCTNIANSLINLACAIVIFIIIFFCIKLIINILDIINDIPILGQINKLLGGALAIFEVVLVTWILFAVLKVVEDAPQLSVVVENIEKSPILSALYKNNVVYAYLSQLFMKFKT